MEIAPPFPFPRYPKLTDSKNELSSVILPEEDVMEIAPPIPDSEEELNRIGLSRIIPTALISPRP